MKIFWYVPLPKVEVMQSCRFDCHSVCIQDYCKSNQLISFKHYVMIRPTTRKNWLTFGGELVLDTDSGSLFLFPHHCRIRNFRRFIAFLINSPASFHNSVWNDWCWQDNESTTFWERFDRHLDPNLHGLIQKSGFESRITLVEIRHLGRGLHARKTV